MRIYWLCLLLLVAGCGPRFEVCKGRVEKVDAIPPVLAESMRFDPGSELMLPSRDDIPPRKQYTIRFASKCIPDGNGGRTDVFVWETGLDVQLTRGDEVEVTVNRTLELVIETKPAPKSKAARKAAFANFRIVSIAKCK